ncbi:MAG: gamma-glutamylcyclotransferase family protein [Cyclobacteriaceae bacterium]
MEEYPLFAFYGSLRTGMYNHKQFERHLEFVRTVHLEGFKLYALEDYPFAVRTRNQDESIVVELFRIRNGKVRMEIDKLELDAGYIREEIEVGGYRAVIYTFQKAENNQEVPGGDWVEFFGK